MRIVFCSNSICHPGGVQTVTIAKANALSQIEGNRVYIIVSEHMTEPICEVDNKVQVIDLNVNYYDDDWKGTYYLLKSFFKKRQIHKYRMKKCLSEILPDVVVSTGFSEKYFLPRLNISSEPIFIREIHYPSNYRQLCANTFIKKLTAALGNFVDYVISIRNYNRIAVLTEKDKYENWENRKNVIVMRNPVTFKVSHISTCQNHKAIAAGRFTDVKNFELLIDVWSEIVKKHPDWTLDLYGSGPLHGKYIKLIKGYRIDENFHIKNYSRNLCEEMSESSLYLMTSLFEGFPSVLVEAMSVGIPCVSINCPYGPSAIISNDVNGYLVESREEMIEKINFLIENSSVRKEMGKNAIANSERFNPSTIANEWMHIFHEAKAEKR